jgi:4'-phosphopantetheinyl transferase EntD
MIAQLLRSGCLPAWIACGGASRAELPAAAPRPEELALLSSRAAPGRREDHALGRIAARRALSSLMPEPPPILASSAGAPLWPVGFVGAITHCGGHALAIAAQEQQACALGLDLEEVRPLKGDIAELVADDDERAWIGADQRRLMALFSAKESVYKAFHRFHGRYFGFDAVRLRCNRSGFDASLRIPLGGWPAGFEFFVHCRDFERFVCTVLWLPPQAAHGVQVQKSPVLLTNSHFELAEGSPPPHLRGSSSASEENSMTHQGCAKRNNSKPGRRYDGQGESVAGCGRRSRAEDAARSDLGAGRKHRRRRLRP